MTVPGAVAGWAALAERFGRLGLDACLEDAIDAAERGFAVAPAHGRAVGGSSAGRSARRRASASSSTSPSSARRCGEIAAEGPSAFYDGRGRRGDLRGVVARGGRPGRVRAALGRAAPAHLQGRRGLRAAAAHAGRLRAGGARPARALVAVARGPDPLRPARARGRASHACATARTCRELITPAYLDARPGRGGGHGAAGRHRLPLRRRRRPDGRLVHPEPVRGLRVGRSSRRAPASSCRTAAPASRSRARSSRAGGRTTRSSRGCSSATASSSARSA